MRTNSRAAAAVVAGALASACASDATTTTPTREPLGAGVCDGPVCTSASGISAITVSHTDGEGWRHTLALDNQSLAGQPANPYAPSAPEALGVSERLLHRAASALVDHFGRVHQGVAWKLAWEKPTAERIPMGLEIGVPPSEGAAKVEVLRAIRPEQVTPGNNEAVLQVAGLLRIIMGGSPSRSNNLSGTAETVASERGPVCSIHDRRVVGILSDAALG